MTVSVGLWQVERKCVPFLSELCQAKTDGAICQRYSPLASGCCLMSSRSVFGQPRSRRSVPNMNTPRSCRVEGSVITVSNDTVWLLVLNQWLYKAMHILPGRCRIPLINGKVHAVPGSTFMQAKRLHVVFQRFNIVLVTPVSTSSVAPTA